MPKDLTVVLQDRPGELARLGEATGSAGVNIQGMCAFTGEGRGIIHVLVDDPKASDCRRQAEARASARQHLQPRAPPAHLWK